MRHHIKWFFSCFYPPRRQPLWLSFLIHMPVNDRDIIREKDLLSLQSKNPSTREGFALLLF